MIEGLEKQRRTNPPNIWTIISDDLLTELPEQLAAPPILVMYGFTV